MSICSQLDVLDLPLEDVLEEAAGLTGLRVCPVGLMKKRQQWIRVSAMNRSRIAVSSFRRYAECWSLI
jgi:hypothetical protein